MTTIVVTRAMIWLLRDVISLTMNYPRLAMDTMKLPDKIESCKIWYWVIMIWIIGCLLYQFISINTVIKLTIHHLFKGINSSKKLSEHVIRIPINNYQIISQISVMNLGDRVMMISLIKYKIEIYLNTKFGKPNTPSKSSKPSKSCWYLCRWPRCLWPFLVSAPFTPSLPYWSYIRLFFSKEQNEIH